MPQISKLASEGLSCREISEKVGVGKTTIALWLHEMQQVRTPPQPRDPAQRIREKVDDYTLMRDRGRKWNDRFRLPVAVLRVMLVKWRGGPSGARLPAV
ncbi:MAG: hypothetical protein ACLP9L_17945 [Thermoguttaceae bacterium]